MRLLLILVLVALKTQTLTYIDEAGNVVSVESLKQVPERYRYQVITPTPAPQLSKKDLRRLQKEMKKQEKLKTLQQKENRAKTPKPKKQKKKDKKSNDVIHKQLTPTV